MFFRLCVCQVSLKCNTSTICTEHNLNMEEISLGNMEQLDDVEQVGNQEQIQITDPRKYKERVFKKFGTQSKHFRNKDSITERNRYSRTSLDHIQNKSKKSYNTTSGRR